MSSESVLVRMVESDEITPMVEISTPFAGVERDIYHFLVDHPELSVTYLTDFAFAWRYLVTTRTQMENWNRSCDIVRQGKASEYA